MSWKSIIASVAPTLATALGGPLAGMATKAATQALFGDEEIPESDLEDRIAAAVSSDPDALLKLKTADNEFKTKMKSLGIDLEKIHAGDRDSARKMAVQTSLLPQMILGALYVIGFMVILYVVFTGKLILTADQKDIAMYLLGILSAGLIQIMNFFFGSSSGSKAKTDKLAMK